MLFPQDFLHLGWHSAPGFGMVYGPTVTVTTEYTFTVSWGMNEVATGQIEYGLTNAYGSTTTLQDLAGGYSGHVQTVSALLPDTLYHFRTVSVNAAGDTVNSSDQTNTTTALGGGATFPTAAVLAFRSLQTLTMPAYLVESTDPEFGTKVMRISDIKNQRHRYSAKAAWSATGRYIILDYLSGSRALLDGTTYAILQSHISTGSNFVWSPTDDSVAWATSGTYIRKYAISDASYTTTNEASLTQFDSISLGGGEGSPSDDAKYIALKIQQGSQYGVAVYDTTTQAIESSVLIGTSAMNNCTMSPSGAYVLVQGSSNGTGVGQGTWSYERSLSTATRIQLNTGLSHRDVVRDPTDSFDQVVLPDSNPSGIYAYRLSDGSRIQLTGYTNRIHVSGRAIDRPGYIYISHYSVNGEGGNYGWAGYGEVFALKTDGSLFDQAESFVQTHRAVSLGYIGEVHASAHPDGSRVIFASEWSSSGGLSDGVYAFVAGVSV